MNKALRVLLTVLPLVYMAAIWFMSSNPDDLIMDLQVTTVDHFIKEALHLVEFAILFMLLAVALAANGMLTVTWSMLAATLAGLYGVLDEFHQYFIPERSASLIDVLKDLIGVLAAYFHVRYHYFTHNRGFLTRIQKNKSTQKR